ncbi:MAG TPA: DUF1587 domain-containing protein [Pirellulaceae bacterium]|nr:DUF1587 domain-containing protein [Pirellulaceae bacterium]
MKFSFATWCLCLSIVSASLLAMPVLELQATDDVRTKFAELEKDYSGQLKPLLKRFCLDCHSTDKEEGELDLERFVSLAEVRRDPEVWQKVVEMLDNGEMPPEDSEQPSDAQRKQLRSWIESYLNTEARANAGDPGPVILRRLSNAECNYTIRDLTGIDSLNPTREFPIDGAAGEGFTNSGSAQAMSPSLVQKYLDAAKEMARHVVLLPSGIRYSPHVTSRDRTDELMDELRRQWVRAKPEDAAKLAANINERQKALWKYNSIGHIGRDGRAKTWMESVSPITSRRDISMKLSESVKDISGDIHAGNPRADSHGNEKTWHFYKGEMKSVKTLTTLITPIARCAGSISV